MYAQVARYCNRSADLIPLSFVLGKPPSSSPWYPSYIFPDLCCRVDSSEGQNYATRSTRVGSAGMGTGAGPGFPEG